MDSTDVQNQKLKEGLRQLRNRLSGRVFAIIIARDEGSCLEKRQLKNRACFVAHEGEIDN